MNGLANRSRQHAFLANFIEIPPIFQHTQTRSYTYLLFYSGIALKASTVLTIAGYFWNSQLKLA